MIKDISLGFNHAIALTDANQVFVWGRRMGIYPNIELNYNFLTGAATSHIPHVEINQDEPRLLRSNLIYYKIARIFTGPWNSALVTDNQQVLIQGDNQYGQLSLGPQIGPLCKFFSNFMKVDFFEQNQLDVQQVSFTGGSSHFLCRDKVSDRNKLFSVGCNDFG